MPEFHDIKAETQRLLVKADLESALDYLSTYIDDYPAELADVPFLKEKYVKVERKNRRNKIGRQAYRVELNKISYSIVGIISSSDNTSPAKEPKHAPMVHKAELLLEEKDLRKVLDFLSTEFKGDPEMENMLILFYARWNSALMDKKKGVIDKKQFKVRRKRLKESIALFVEEIDSKGLAKSEKEDVLVKPSKKRKKEANKALLRFILLLQIAIIMGIAYVIFHLPA